jgi:glutamine cyclotransferase
MLCAVAVAMAIMCVWWSFTASVLDVGQNEYEREDVMANNVQHKTTEKTATAVDHKTTESAVDVKPCTFGFTVLETFEHDAKAFTQGLAFDEKSGFLYEGTGLYKGRSSLRKLDAATGKVLQQVPLANKYFGENIVY